MKEEEEAVDATKFAPHAKEVVVHLEVEGPFRAKVRHLEADGRLPPLDRRTEIQLEVQL
jgi:hypothetical protein